MADDNAYFILESAAKRGTGNYVRMRSTQLNARAIGRVFNFFPQSVYLVGDDGSVELPDDDGNFEVENMNAALVWTCSGDSSKSADGQAQSQWLQPGPSYAYQSTDQARERERQDRSKRSQSASGKWKPKFTTSFLSGIRQNKPPGVEKQEARLRHVSQPAWTKTIEICTFEGSKIKKSFNLPVSLTERSATVDRVAEFVSAEAFEGAAVVLLDSDNLRIPDSTGTRGMKFWRSTRKVKAIQEEEYESLFKSKGKAKWQAPEDLSDSDSDFEPPKKMRIDLTKDSDVTVYTDSGKRGRTAGDRDNLGAIDQRLQNIEVELSLYSDARQNNVRLREEIARLEAELGTMVKSVDDIKECLSCLVCKAVAAFPWNVTPCCSVLMCRECAERWFTLQQTCPHCRAAVNLGTCQEVRSIRSLEHHITIWRANTDNTEQPQVD